MLPGPGYRVRLKPVKVRLTHEKAPTELVDEGFWAGGGPGRT